MADPPIATRAPESDAMESDAPGTEYSTPLPTPLPHRLDPVRGVSDFGTHLFSKQPTPSATQGGTAGFFPHGSPIQSSVAAPSVDPPPYQTSRKDTLDTMEDSPIPSDSKAQTGASMGEHCTTDRPISGQSSAGQMTKFGDIDVYVSKPADYPQSPSKLLLLLTGGTGVHSINNQLQADKYAAEGFVVVMPDQFSGDPAPNTTTTETPDPNPSIIEQVKLRAAETAKSFMLDMWLARQTEEKVMPIVHQVLSSAKDEYADAVANGGGVYAAGYCFGAKYVIILAGEHPDSVMHGARTGDEEQGMVSTGPLIKAGAIAHGTSVTVEDVAAIKAPLALLCVENDQLFPDEVLEAARHHLEGSNIEHQIKVYPDVPHGFAVVGDYKEAHIQEAQRTAFAQMLAWLQAH